MGVTQSDDLSADAALLSVHDQNAAAPRALTIAIAIRRWAGAPVLGFQSLGSLSVASRQVLALKLCNRPDNVHHGPAEGSGEVDPLFDKVDADAAASKRQTLSARSHMCVKARWGRKGHGMV